MKFFITGWQVAYRQKPTGTILSDNKSAFYLIPNTWRYMAADPFLFEYEGKTYLFAELLDNLTLKGVIGYSVWNGKKFTKWKPIIREAHHLSFPNIFWNGNDIFIVPEAYESKEIYSYKATTFPDKWERHKPFINAMPCVDTVFLHKNDDIFGFTCRIGTVDDFVEKNQMMIFKTDFINATFLPNNPIMVGDYGCRAAGNFFVYNGKTIRVSQDCVSQYGASLIFTEIEDDFSTGIKENKLKHIGVDQIDLNSRKRIYGIHTYNSNEQFEVIDVKPIKYNIISIAVRMAHKVIKFFRR